MNEDVLNMSLRKFLKKVGVTGQARDRAGDQDGPGRRQA